MLIIVDDILTMEDTIRVQEEAFSKLPTGGALVYIKAKEQGLGREIPTEWFLQDIRD